MSGFFETLLGGGGAILGGVGGGVGGAVVGAATEGMIGAAVGGAGGAVFAGVGAVPGAAAGATIGGGYGATVGGVTGAVAGGVGGWALGSEAGANIDQQLSDWWNADDAAEKADAKATAITCATCAQNPCAHLACGVIVPGNKYRGGAHGCMTGTEETKGDGLESHHMPAKSKSPLHPNVGPAIQMEPRPDHQMTASHSGKVNGPTYAAQRALLDKGNVYAAFLLDAADAKRIAIAVGDPTRYDLAIAQAKLYADCLKKTGVIR